MDEQTKARLEAGARKTGAIIETGLIGFAKRNKHHLITIGLTIAAVVVAYFVFRPR